MALLGNGNARATTSRIEFVTGRTADGGSLRHRHSGLPPLWHCCHDRRRRTEYVLPPEVVGKPRVGERLVCGSGTWKGAPHFEYRWVREANEIAKGPTYTLSKADEHKEVWCIVTARVGTEEAEAESINGICLAGGCGVVQDRTAGKRKKTLGLARGRHRKWASTLTCSPGVWRGKPSPTFSYKWYRDGSEAITGATGERIQNRR